ncbi:hypothetical protein CVD28_26325 [Bacillus sp. M6-12]|uniref:YbfB/YjiJ family MFS transporter n=1 Tax=Bacillus sp. M6-12 TaxID=2054166 RepID=UPI000C781148|nr:YbfB/YjiJ family MFS transporter [Bacillus sp. M6-12]PLS14816.1 hypothetical protein CVD28_26325 [Bacillus sp. M6-12]
MKNNNCFHQEKSFFIYNKGIKRKRGEEREKWIKCTLKLNSAGFSEAAAGYLASCNFLGYLVGAFCARRINHKGHPKILIRILFANIISIAAMGVTDNYVIWLILRFISGISSGLIFVLCSSFVLDALAKRGLTSSSGFFYSGVGIGIFITGISVPLSNTYFGWKGAWLFLAGLSVLLGFLVSAWLKVVPETNDNKQNETVDRDEKNDILPWLVLAYGLEGLGYIISGTFLVDIFNGIAGFTFFVFVKLGFCRFSRYSLDLYLGNYSQEVWFYFVHLSGNWCSGCRGTFARIFP